MVRAVGGVRLDAKTSFTFQFLRGARMFATDAEEFEKLKSVTNEQLTSHRSLIMTSIMQSVAALEAEAYSLINDAPGFHKGTNDENLKMKEFLNPLADMIDRLPVLERYEKVLHLLKKPKLEKGSDVYQDAKLAVSLRNEITHFKSLRGEVLEKKQFVKRLKSKNFTIPPFQSKSSNFFPHQVLGSECAHWTVSASKDFLKEFYERVGYPCRVEKYGKNI